MNDSINDKEILNFFPWAIFQISFIILLTILFTLIVGITMFTPIIKKDIHKYKCKLSVAPFISFIDPSISIVANAKQCISDTIKPIFKKQADQVLAPQAEKVQKNQNEATNEADRLSRNTDIIIKKNVNTMSNFLESFNIFRELLTYISIKVKHIFLKIQTLIIIWYYLLVTQINTVFIAIGSLYNIVRYLLISGAIYASNPITAPLSAVFFSSAAAIKISDAVASNQAFCCFSPTSQIHTSNNTFVNIENISLGQKLEKCSVVLGKIKVLNKYTHLIQINPTLQITPDHIIFDKNKWIHAKKYIHKNSSISSHNPNYLYCLVTSNNIIPAKGCICRDYEETKNRDIQTQLSFEILNKLNHNIQIFNIKQEYEIGETNNCLLEDTLVRTFNDKTIVFKKIKDINIGDSVGENNKVIGIYTCHTDLNTWGILESKKTNEITRVSPRLIIKHIKLTNHLWNKSYNSEYFKFNNNEKFKTLSNAFHLITEQNYFIIKLPSFSTFGEIYVRDFVETSYISVQNNIDSLVLNHLNLN
jgi:hypothetical protein